MNRTILVGRLTKDPNIRYTQNGIAVTNFTLAINRTFTNKQGEREADFVNCVTFRKTAENLSNYMKKGSRIGVDGRIQTRRYQNNNDDTVFVTEVVAENIQFLESKDSNNTTQPTRTESMDNNQTKNQNNDPFSSEGETLDISDDELPF